MSTSRLRIDESFVLVVDVQDKLLAKMPTAATLVKNVGFVLDAANLLSVSTIATEQYPKGLGPTTSEIARRLPPDMPAKTAFSCCGASGFTERLRSMGRASCVLVGMETHVCVLQTGLDLLASGFTLFVPVDAVASRGTLDQDLALRRLERAGAILTTAETVAFEWVGDASHSQFKAISKLVIERAA